jgi:hypothetical protein
LGSNTKSPPSDVAHQNLSTRVVLGSPPQVAKSYEHPSSPRSTIKSLTPSSPTEQASTSRASSPTQKRVSEFSFGGASLRYSSSSYASSMASSGGWSSPGTPLISHQSLATNKRSSPLPRTLEVREPGEHSDTGNLSLLPPPALKYTVHSELERHTPKSTLSPFPSQPDLVKLHRSSTTSSQKAAFEKEAFRNSAVLCDV